jgi:phosphoribosylamine--glycine ligase
VARLDSRRMRILIVGNGGREHALLWKLRRDAPSAEIFVTRPNGGMAPHCQPVELAPTDVEALSGWAGAHHIDLTVIGPEGPLAAGIVDRFQAKGLSVFGPTKAAARIEASKAYAKELMRTAGVPTAEHRTFTELESAEAYVRERGAPIVVKASGLAAGKGAVVCASVEEAIDAVRSMLGTLAFGEAGREVVIEEHMEGEELSVFAITDGERCVILVPAQDHKRVGDGDKGPNTGGMGAYSPAPCMTEGLIAQTIERIIKPTVAALEAQGHPYRGVLYAGLMLTKNGPKLIEYNARFGDPETQVMLPRMESDLLPLLLACAEGTLAQQHVVWKNEAALTVVLASKGYPGDFTKGNPIKGLDRPFGAGVEVFHAGTALKDDQLVSNGGRVLNVTALGASVKDAQTNAYAIVDKIDFPEGFCRRDIGWRAV